MFVGNLRSRIKTYDTVLDKDKQYLTKLRSCLVKKEEDKYSLIDPLYKAVV
ncbi:MAG: hypothetical protein RXQ22_06310 [Sulfolobus sp.]